MNHSNQVREFLLSEHGIEVRDAYLGPHGVLTGSARLAQESRDREEGLRQSEETEQRVSHLEARRKAVEAQIEALKAELEAVTQSAGKIALEAERRQKRIVDDRQEMARSRRVNGALRSQEKRNLS